jgi:hypothetical protein
LIKDSLINSKHSTLRRINVTTISLDIKAHYLELIEQREGVYVYVSGKMLEDVDIQE